MKTPASAAALLACHAALTALVGADTPVHCLLEQMYGEWTVEMTEPIQTTEQPLHSPPTCQGSAFSQSETMRLLAPNKVAWEGPDTPTDDRPGTFTMVYDEGWEVRGSAPANAPSRNSVADRPVPGARRRAHRRRRFPHGMAGQRSSSGASWTTRR
eukprot:SAG11_NODE_2595_length_3185_cov_8.000324_2_plen_156_part_00